MNTSEPAESREPRPLRILVVDDDEVDRMTVRRALRTAGVHAEFTEAEDVRVAVTALKEKFFDCAFLDFRLPGGDGLDVLRKVRAAGVRTPVVMLTGQGDEQLAVELMKAGASDYLSKGVVSPERLERSLRYVLRVHRAEMQAREAEAAREVAITARARFYAAMSHELRTPINAIIGYNDLLLASIYGTLNEQQLYGVDRAQRAARHLLELVNDILDLSKLEAGKMELQVELVSIPELIEDLFTTIRPLADEHGCTLSFSCEESSVVVHTDPRRVRQILLNILSNAIKFGQSKPVELRCGQTPERGAVVEVLDHGPGIAAADLSRIFEEFVQLGHAPHTGTTGTGLGLPISMRLAELLRGKLEVESTTGEGSVFRLVLPSTLQVEAAAPEGGGSTG
ncbi:hypothetical protein BH23GEM3_BH23GEM3_02990 [soil metagenome]